MHFLSVFSKRWTVNRWKINFLYFLFWAIVQTLCLRTALKVNYHCFAEVLFLFSRQGFISVFANKKTARCCFKNCLYFWCHNSCKIPWYLLEKRKEGRGRFSKNCSKKMLFQWNHNCKHVFWFSTFFYLKKWQKVA